VRPAGLFLFLLFLIRPASIFSSTKNEATTMSKHVSDKRVSSPCESLPDQGLARPGSVYLVKGTGTRSPFTTAPQLSRSNAAAYSHFQQAIWLVPDIIVQACNTERSPHYLFVWVLASQLWLPPYILRYKAWPRIRVYQASCARSQLPLLTYMLPCGDDTIQSYGSRQLCCIVCLHSDSLTSVLITSRSTVSPMPIKIRFT
jgi:hypothetical protein